MHLSHIQNYLGSNTMTATPELDDDAIAQRLQKSRRLEDAPEHVIQRVLDLWQKPRRAEAGGGLMRRIRAVLSFDSGAASPVAFGMRSSGGTTRQMLFSAEGHDVDLRISPAASDNNDPTHAGWQLSGQVLGPDCSGIVVLTNTDDGAMGESSLDELGEFRLPVIRSGSYSLTLRLTDLEVELSTIDVPHTL